MDKPSKFSIADVLTLVGASIFSYYSYQATYFLTLGNFGKSLGLAIFIFIALFITVFGAKWFKLATLNFKNNIIREFICIGLFLVLLTIFTFTSIAHYYTVTDRKTDIQKESIESIIQAENMFTAYEEYAKNRISIYESNLKRIIASKDSNPTEYAAFGFKNNYNDDEEQVNKKLGDIKFDLFPSNYSDSLEKGIKDVATKWFTSSRNQITSWKAMGVVDVTKEVAKNAEKWKNELVKFSKRREKGETAKDFSYQLEILDISEKFTIKGENSIGKFMISSITLILMLFSYAITKRNTRFPGFKMVFSSKEKFDNEL
jgi:uncharacterized protein (UPF0333 family)